MTAPHLPRWQSPSEERWFKGWLWGSILLYVGLAVTLKLLPLPQPQQADYRTVAPRIAKLLIKPQVQPKVQEAAKPAEEAPPEAKEERKPEEKKTEAKKQELTPEQLAKRNRQVAMKSGLLKLLSKRQNTAAGAEKLIRDASTLKSVAGGPRGSDPLLDSLSGSGGIDQLIGDLGGKLEGIRLAEKQSAAVENPLQLKDTEGKPVGRAYESIASVVDGLKGWIRFIYNKALREDPNLKGVVTLEFTITKDGDVDGVSVASTTLNYPPIEEALVKRFKLLKFPAAPKGGSVTVVYPITFSPSG
ncbi:MAG: AgmX/PglI C-terminal domain-containing protein [Nitrospirota bacterium]